MKKFYLTLLLFAALAIGASAQVAEELSLARIISEGQLSEFYTIENDLVGVYSPPHRPRVIFAKDADEYANRSYPTEEQYNANPKRLYDERDGHFEESVDWWGETVTTWVGSFDQSNWVKIVLPEGADASVYEGKVIRGGTVTGRVNLQNFPCNPLGLTITLNDDADLPEVGGDATYEPNLYCTANFVKQEEWYLVKPQNQEYANIRWAVFHAADTMFYAPVNNSGLPGSFKFDMSLWEPQPGIDPFEVFEDGYMYHYPAMIEFRLGVTIGLNIDPGFDGDIIIWYDPDEDNAPTIMGLHRMDVIDNPGTPPTFTDGEGHVYLYNVIVYPLRLEEDGEWTGIEETETTAKTVVSKRYIDLQGHVSDKPFEGLNIVQTTYSDGSTSVTKVMSK